MSFKEVLDSKGISQYALEQLTGMNSKSINNLVSGKSRIENVPVGNVMAMVNALGFDSVESFVNEARNPKKKLYVVKMVYVRPKKLDQWEKSKEEKIMGVYTLLSDALDEIKQHSNDQDTLIKGTKRRIIWAVQEGWYDEPMIEDIPDGLVTEEESKLLSKAFVEGGEWYSDFKAD